MKNVIICKSCSTENPYYEVICLNCHSFLREKIFNIDLWKTIEVLIDSPVKAFRRIIQSEHKNFISLIFIFAVFKLFISSIFISLAIFKNEHALNFFIIRFLFFAGGMLILFIILSLLLLLVIKGGGIKTRFKDLFAVLTYSLMPYSFAAIILFPIELIIFGQYLFSVNPSPFIIKSFFAWVLLSLEFLLILWSVFLTVTGIFAQTKSLRFSLVNSIIFNIIVYSSIYFYSVYLIL
jgi:Yip1 domain